MTDSFNNHIISGQINLPDSFEHKPEILGRRFTISRDFERAIWEQLKEEHYLGKYELLSTNFQSFETIEFVEDYGAIGSHLKPLKETVGNVLLTWASGMINPLVTDTETFVDNWDDFYYPSSDDLIAISEDWDWICYFAHYGCFYFGKGSNHPA